MIGRSCWGTAAVTALLDRLLHHAHVLKCGLRSWRTKLQGDFAASGEREINLNRSRAATEKWSDFPRLQMAGFEVSTEDRRLANRCPSTDSRMARGKNPAQGSYPDWSSESGAPGGTLERLVPAFLRPSGVSLACPVWFVRGSDYAANLYQTYTATTAPRIANIANTNRLGLSVA